MNKLLFLLGGLAILLTGCSTAAGGHPYRTASANSDQAVIYVYRDNVNLGSALMLNITVNGQYIGRLLNNGYLYTVVPAGAHTVATERETLAVSTKPSQSYFVKVEFVPEFLNGRPKFTLVPEETGKAAIADTRYSGEERDPTYHQGLQNPGSPIP